MVLRLRRTHILRCLNYLCKRMYALLYNATSGGVSLLNKETRANTIFAITKKHIHAIAQGRDVNSTQLP